MTSPVLVEREKVALLLIDAQPLFFREARNPSADLLSRLEGLLMLAGAFGLPTLATLEEPTARKGTLHDPLKGSFPGHGKVFSKHTYDCWAEPEIREALLATSRAQIAVAGAETDVCVLQSALSLQANGFQVFLLEDCLFTSETNPRPALERMYRCGVIPHTYKMFAYELTRSVRKTPWLPEGEAAPEKLPPGFPSPG